MSGPGAVVLVFRRSWIGRLVDWSDDHGGWGMLALNWLSVLVLSACGLLGIRVGHLIGAP